MEDCLFCKIINGEIPSIKVYENEYVIAFNDISPVAPVHVLIIPKIHIKDTNYITEENIEYISQVMLAIKEVVKITNIEVDGYRVITNTGVHGGQVVPHLHLHLIGGKMLPAKLAE